MYESLLTFPGGFFADFDRLQREMDQLFGAGSLPASIRATGRGAFPAINIGTTADTLEVMALLPGVDASQLELSVDKGLLIIAGKRPTDLPQEDDKTTCYAHERFNGEFKRVVTLPDDADPQRVDATYRDGVLHVTVHKRESAKPRRIAVS
jgi:HSP20 family protein